MDLGGDIDEASIMIMRHRILWGSGVVIALLLAFPAAAFAASGAATVTCPLQSDPSWNMYTADAATLAACDLVAYPVASVTQLPGGGTETTYATPGAPQSEITPPASFDPGTASAAQLAEYGIPPEPAASDATGQAQWKAMISHMVNPGPAPSEIIGSNAPQFRRDPISYVQNGPTGWAGYTDNESTGYFHYAWGDYDEPTLYSSSCGSSTAAVPWVGIGGVDTNNFGQAGTEIGAESGGAEHQFWYETNVGTIYWKDFYATAGNGFVVDVYYDTSNDDYYYYGYNQATGVYHTYPSYSSTYGGATTDFVVERLKSGYLSNFGTMEWFYAESASQQYPLDYYPYWNWQLLSNGSPEATANDTTGSTTTPGPVSGAGPFYIHQNWCG